MFLSERDIKYISFKCTFASLIFPMLRFLPILQNDKYSPLLRLTESKLKKMTNIVKEAKHRGTTFITFLGSQNHNLEKKRSQKYT